MGGSPAAATTTSSIQLLGSGAKCRMRNNTAAPSGWTGTYFDSSSWPWGVTPVGHLKPVTTDFGAPARTAYLRCPFNVDNADAVTGATLTARVDDGAVLYLNGQEVARTNMPAGADTFNTSASTVDSYDGQRWQTWQISPALLKAYNVLSVSVHQNFVPGWISQDAVFDAKIDATVRRAATTVAPPSVPAPTITPTPKPTPTITPPSMPTPKPPAGWKTAFADEFDGTSVKTSNWKVYNNTYGDGDPNMLHCLTPNNVVVSNGSVKLNAKKGDVTCANGKAKSYSSGFLGSREAARYHPLYGRYEMRARTPHGQGLFPALWLRHRNGSSVAEIDIFENFHSSSPGQATSTVHFPTSIGYNVAKKGTNYETAVRGRGGWHTFGVDIQPVTPGDDTKVNFKFTIDGVTTLNYTNTNASKWTSVDKNAAWDIALQLYVGGTWAGHPDQKLGFYPASGGICARTSKKPLNGDIRNCPTSGIWLAPWQDSTFEIDYVRVYTKS